MSRYSGPLRFAHRGVAQAAPENTLESFQAAVDAGLEGIELDIRMSRDGEIVVVHDETLSRLTHGHPTREISACIADLTWEELSAVELSYAGHLLEQMPPPDGKARTVEAAGDVRMSKLMRLSDMLQWLSLQPGDTAVEIECKAPGMIPRLLRILDSSPLCPSCIVFSGEPGYIEEIQTTCAREGKPKGLKLGANIRRLTDEAKAGIMRMDLYEIGLNDGCVTKEDMQWLSDRGILAFSNLGDYPAWWETACELGMHALKTNYVSVFTDWWLSRFGK